MFMCTYEVLNSTTLKTVCHSWSTSALCRLFFLLHPLNIFSLCTVIPLFCNVNICLSLGDMKHPAQLDGIKNALLEDE